MKVMPDVYPYFYFSCADAVSTMTGQPGYILTMETGLYSTLEKTQDAAEQMAKTLSLMVQKENAGPLN